MTAARHLRQVGRARRSFGMPTPGLRAVCTVVAVGAMVAAVMAVRDAAPWGSTHGGASAPAATLDLVAGIALLAAGSMAGSDPRTRRFGVVLLLAAAAWHAGDLAGWEGASAAVRIPALAGWLLLGPLLLVAVLLVPGREPLSAPARRLVRGVFLIAIILGIAILVGLDPRSDAGCWRICSANPYRLTGLPEDPTRGGATLAFQAAVGLTILAVAVMRLRTAAARVRRDSALALAAAAVTGILLATTPAAVALTGRAGPTDAVASALFLATGVTVAALGAAIIAVTAHDRRVREGIRSLAWLDGPGRPSARDAIATATRDPGLRVAYPGPDGAGVLDMTGTLVDPDPAPGRAVAEVRRSGKVVALIDHDPDIVDDADLADLLGPAMRLALENERLDAEVLFRLAELRTSLARVVAAGDRERRRRERDLHDGAQQRLLALVFDLRSVRAATDRDADAAVLVHLDAAIAGVHAALADVRTLAHGIHPAVLAGAGLAAALETLAEDVPMPLRLDAPTDTGAGPLAELTAYTVTEALVRDAAGRGATVAAVTVRRERDRLVVEIEDDGRPADAPPMHALDRAGAVGGRLELRAGDPAGRRMHLEVPCASS